MRAATFALRILALVVILFVGHVVAANIAGFVRDEGTPDPVPTDASPGVAKQSSEKQLQLLFTVVGVCALEAMALVYPIRRSRWAGWKLSAAVFFVFVGVMTIQPQLEAAFFRVLPAGMLVRILLMGTLIAALFSPLAVLILGRWTPVVSGASAAARLDLSALQWALKLGVTAAFYVALYTAFGHFIAWQNPEVREFYGGASSGGGLDQLGLFVIPSLGPFQALRACLWVALALPVLGMMRGKWWESGLALGLLFAVLMNAQLLLPNPYMPEAVRMVHLVETASSNFLLGWWIAWLFHRNHSSVRDLFGIQPARNA